jgi:hypothetical protein
MEVAQQDRCFRASDDKYDEHKEKKSKHVVHLTWPADSEISSHNAILFNLCSHKILETLFYNSTGLVMRSKLSLQDRSY